MARKPTKPKNIETLKHDDAKRRNIPTAEYQSIMSDADKSPRLNMDFKVISF